VIFISNHSFDEIDPPIRSRSLLMDLEMTRHEILERMAAILPHLTIKATPEQRKMAMDFIRRLARRIS